MIMNVKRRDAARQKQGRNQELNLFGKDPSLDTSCTTKVTGRVENKEKAKTHNLFVGYK